MINSGWSARTFIASRWVEPSDGQPRCTDEDLITAHVAGNPGAFGELVRRHRGRLWALAVRTTRDPDEAADALQDALFSAHRGASNFRADAKVTTWLHRIVLNACYPRSAA